MERKFIGAGLLAGLVAGLVGFGFARWFIEPLVAEAIDYEGLRSHAEEHLHGGEHGHEHGELFSRSIQENVGAGIGTVVFAVAIGALFAVVFTVAWAYLGRYRPSTDPRLVAVVQGAVAFVAVIGVPFFVYPPNPPAVGEEDTIGARSSAYLTITVVSVLVAALLVVAALWLAPRVGGLLAGVGSVVVYLVVMAVTAALLPTFAEVPGPLMDGDVIVAPGFPGQVVADYRIYAVAAQVLMFAVLTAVFAGLVNRMMRPVETPPRERVAA